MEATQASKRIRLSSRDEVTINDLPNELIIEIVQHMNASSLLSFSGTCKRFFSVCQSSSNSLNFENSHKNGLLSITRSTGSLIHKFLDCHLNPSLLNRVNVNGCYFIKPEVLEKFLIQCQNLEKLEVAETRLTIQKIVAHILPHCNSVTSLSFTLSKWDFEKWQKNDPGFLQGSPALSQLLSVEIIMDKDNSHGPNNVLFEFLNKCINLEQVVALGASGYHLTAYDALPGTKLKSFIYVGYPLDREDLSWDYMWLFNQQRQITTFWSNIMDIPYSNLEMESNRFIGLSWNVPRDRQLQENIREQVRLPTLRSVWEPFAVFMQAPESSPQLELVNCVYDGLAFRDFCLNHELIEVMKLRYGGGQTGMGKATPLEWNSETWRNLPKLRILSLEANLIATEEAGNDSRSPFMLSVTLNCPLIQELELIGRGVLETIKVEELLAISHCSKLKKLLISNIMVANGQFFEAILKGCPLLESLRLKNVGNPEKCCYSSSLVTFLPLAKKLRTFCVQQQFMELDDLEKLLDTLEKCSLLSRVSLILPKVEWKDPNQFIWRFEDFCENLEHLVVLFTMMIVPDDACKQSEFFLRAQFREKRPALHVDLQHTNEGRHGYHLPRPYDSGYFSQKYLCEQYHSMFLPTMHNDVLTKFESNVALLPIDHDSILHRLE